MANPENLSVFEFSKDDYNFTSKPWNGETIELSKFDTELGAKWEKAMNEGYFRYRLDQVETKKVGPKNYVIQLNVKRGTERRDPQNILYLNQPFNPKEFNFTKIKPGEILFHLQENGENGKKAMTNGETNGIDKDYKQSKDLIIINASPLEFGHVLAVPDADSLMAQKVSEYCMRMSLQMMLLSNHRGFHVGFNSLCALSSVNHQHVHAYYLEHELYVEYCPVRHISGPVYELDTMPVKGFAFQLHGLTLEKLSNLLFKVMNYFQESEIAHNFYMTKGTVFGEERMSDKRTIRVYVWPRKKYVGMKDEVAFNVATVELAGHVPIKIIEQYHSMTAEYIETTLKASALDETEYQAITDKVIQLCS